MPTPYHRNRNDPSNSRQLMGHTESEHSKGMFGNMYIVYNLKCYIRRSLYNYSV